jgi:hypothetical protein
MEADPEVMLEPEDMVPEVECEDGEFVKKLMGAIKRVVRPPKPQQSGRPAPPPKGPKPVAPPKRKPVGGKGSLPPQPKQTQSFVFEWEERSKTRADELAALAETIRLLNDDDSLELFKRTLPSPSFLQMKHSAKAVQQKAVRILKSANGHKDPRMELVMLALMGKGTGFAKVLKMIDEMVALLGKEQEDSNTKKEVCSVEIDMNEDKKKALEVSISGLGV